MQNNIIDSIQLSGVTYQIQGSGGGGKAIEAGRGISITTGETADTVSFNLPISAGTGSNSIIEGASTTASGDYSHAEGYNTKTNGYTSHAEGISTTASGSSSHAEGNNTTANGDQSHAEGYYAKASGNYSHAEGYYTIASGISSHAEGFYTTANGNQSHAEGFNTTASGKYSHAEGDWTIANNQSEHASGQYNVSSSASTTFGDSGNTLFSVGNGTAANARHNAFEIRQNGDIYLSSGGTDIKLQDHLGGGGGNPTVELTQAEYDALVTAGTVAQDTYYIITDAQAVDLTNYYTKSETNTLLGGKANTATTYTKTEVDAALGGKQATLVSGTNIKTINNTSILGSGNIDIQGGGGGKAIEAGRGISITTGETADTVSFNLAIYDRGNTSVSECHYEKNNTPICSSNYCHLEQPLGMIGSNSNSSHKEGVGSKIGDNSNNSHVEGLNCEVGNFSPYSHAEGQYTKTSNQSEHASGQFNASSKASTTFGNSGNTLFSVGNGTSNNARHNAFEIRQNGDIYCSDGTNDVKLQDTITATAANTTALGGLKLVKLTQSAYDALSPNYDSNTLYVIVN